MGTAIINMLAGDDVVATAWLVIIFMVVMAGSAVLTMVLRDRKVAVIIPETLGSAAALFGTVTILASASSGTNLLGFMPPGGMFIVFMIELVVYVAVLAVGIFVGNRLYRRFNKV